MHPEDEMVEETVEETLSEEEQEEIRLELMERLDSLGMSLAGSRSDAIRHRTSCGIEQAWIEDEEQYEGIDDANRGEMQAWQSKPLGQAMPSTEESTGSTVFVNITRPYVDASAARVADMLLPTDDRSWELKPTPMPDLIPLARGKLSLGMEQAITKEATGEIQQEQQAAQQGGITGPMMGPMGQAAPQAAPGAPGAAPGAQPQPQPSMQDQVAQRAEEKKQAAIAEAQRLMEEAKRKAELAARRIDDWHVECQYHAEMRSVIEDCSKAGTGVLKGPYPKKKRMVAYIEGTLQTKEEIRPVSTRINYWNLFPDPACGESIHNGSFIWECDDITAKQLAALKGTPNYVSAQIDECLSEGAHKAVSEMPTDGNDNPLNGLSPREKKGLFQIWYYHGKVSVADLEAAGVDAECDDKDKALTYDAQITLVNNRVIKAALNPLESGEFPYDVMVWQRRKGMPWGTGVSRHIRTPQRIVNGAARNMMDNAGLAGGPQLIIKQGIVSPADGIAEFRPRKAWIAAEDADLDNLDNAFRFVTAPMLQTELQNIIMLGMKLAEDVTGLPALMQGQMGQVGPDTVGGMNILNNNANTVLRRIARLYDDLITEPHIRRYYDYLLEYGENDDEKGDFTIDARGSSALIERDTQNQQIMQMGQIAFNPMSGIDPKKWTEEMLKSQRFDVKRFQYDDEEWQQIVQNMSQPQDSSVQVAQMKAESDQAIAQMKEQGKQAVEDIRAQVKAAEMESKNNLAEQRLALDAQTTQQRLQATSTEKAQDREMEVLLKSMDMKMDQMKEGGKKNLSLDEIKAMLAKTAMQLRTQKELAGIKQVTTPPTEPPGRAENGRAYSQ